MTKNTHGQKRKSATEKDIEIIKKVFEDVKNDPKTMKEIREKLLKPIEA